jgi:CheY-like chemotaxis protein/HPt (histidine-containing phosphotransfer) domain-containing protein
MEEQLSDAVGAIWERNADAQARRLACQERAIVSLLAGTLGDDERQAAVGEAHKLVGSLGSFGLEEGSSLARELETAWQATSAEAPGDPVAQAMHMAERVVKLQALLRDRQPVAPPGVAESATPDGREQVDVLLVDDDEMFADFVVDTLRRRKRQVHWLADGEAARDALCGPHAPMRARLVLLDVEMPRLDGFSVLEQLARSGITQTSSVVMLTGHTLPDDIVRARKLGVADYLAKPLKAQMLVERVERALAAHTRRA